MAKTYVYRNLHRDQWSLMVRGLVKAHEDDVVLADAEFRVRPAGHAKVLREKRKNVHAFAVGRVVDSEAEPTEGEPVAISYNPYKGAYFYRKDTGERVEGARVVLLSAMGTVLAWDLR